MVKLQVVHEPGDRWREQRADTVTSSVETEPGGCLRSLVDFRGANGSDRRVQSDMDATLKALEVEDNRVTKLRVEMHAYEETWTVGTERETRGTDLAGGTFVVHRDVEAVDVKDGAPPESSMDVLKKRFLVEDGDQVQASLTEPRSVEEGETFQAPEWIEHFRTELRRTVTESETNRKVPVHSLQHRKGTVRYRVSDVSEQKVTLRLEGEPVYDVAYTAQGNRMRQEMVLNLTGTVVVDGDQRKVVQEDRTVERDTFYYTGGRLLARAEQTTASKVTRDVSPFCTKD